MTEDEKRRRKAAVKRTREKLRPFEETHPHLKEFAAFLDDFNKETERGAALAATAFLDDTLNKVVTAFLIESDASKALLNGFNAPLGTLAARTAAAHAMGLISDTEKDECNLIRRIRNEFAHRVRMTFDNASVKAMCAKLMMSVKPYGTVTVSTRGQFTTAAVALILNLANRPHYVSEHRLKYREWKY